MPKDKQPATLSIPPPIQGTDHWLVFGLDLSLSRTGWAVLHVKKDGDKTQAKFLRAGSVKPETANAPVWVRSVLVSRGLVKILLSSEVEALLDHGAGVIFAFEAATPRNDFLTSISRVAHSVLFAAESRFASGPVRILSVNANTLRSLMHLTKRGAKNKSENILRAFDFIDKTEFPELDGDACDAVLMAMVGRHACSVLLGHSEEVPTNFLNALCNAAQETRGKGRNARIITKGIFHRPEYWAEQVVRPRVLCVKDARNPKKTLERISIPV